jgi:hypothetical protein
MQAEAIWSDFDARQIRRIGIFEAMGVGAKRKLTQGAQRKLTHLYGLKV